MPGARQAASQAASQRLTWKRCLAALTVSAPTPAQHADPVDLGAQSDPFWNGAEHDVVIKIVVHIGGYLTRSTGSAGG